MTMRKWVLWSLCHVTEFTYTVYTVYIDDPYIDVSVYIDVFEKNGIQNILWCHTIESGVRKKSVGVVGRMVKFPSEIFS